MEDHQERVVNESAELRVKICALTSFIYSEKSAAVKPEDLDLMRQQLATMQHYDLILRQRIATFK